LSTHVVIEGSSCANGFGDELQKGGFTGRIDSHIREHYEHLITTGAWTPEAGWGYVTNHAIPARLLPSWLDYMPGHMDENFGRTRYQYQTARLGMFVLEGHPLHLQKIYDKSHLDGSTLLQTWRDSLEKVKDECADRQVHALFVQMPPPRRKISQIGYEIHAMLTEQTRRTCASIDEGEGTYVSVADMLEGQETDNFTYKDNMHPNGRGHELIFRHLLPIIYDRLGITPHESLPDPAEVLKPTYTP
jgi:hypothetical protein